MVDNNSKMASLARLVGLAIACGASDVGGPFSAGEIALAKRAESTSARDARRAVAAVRDGGAFTSVRGFEGVPQRDIRFAPTWVRSYAQEWEKLDRLRQLAEAGEITLRVAQVYPPEQAADAHRRLEAGGTRGRLVIQF